MLEHTDNAWMAALDWSLHGPKRKNFVSRHAFLANVAEMLVKEICAPLPDTPDLLRRANAVFDGSLAEAAYAFHDDGSARDRIHSEMGAEVRRRGAALGIYPESPDSISISEWEDIHLTSALMGSEGDAARTAAARIAPVIARLAADKRIVTLARPIGGGDDEAVPITPDRWAIDPDLAVTRLARCGINLDRPMDRHAEPDHLIFVSYAGLQRAIDRAARENYVANGWQELQPFERSIDRRRISAELVADALITLMTDDHLHWRSEDFQAAIEARFGESALGRVYNRARRIATDHPDRHRFRTPGSKGL